jgi:hypothetical protein
LKVVIVGAGIGGLVRPPSHVFAAFGAESAVNANEST